MTPVSNQEISEPAPITVGAQPSAVFTGGSDRPEVVKVRIGFMPLSDCASVVMASLLGFDRKYGIRIIPVRESSWAAVRDKLVSGNLDMAQALYGLIYGVHMGISGRQKDMAVLMTLNRNGQGLTLSRNLAYQGITTLERLERQIRCDRRRYTFAQTFPTGTHAMWQCCWLASAGINPFSDVDAMTVAPPQMVSHMQRGHVDGFSVGEPWNQRAIVEDVGISVASSQDIWPDHPEKVLGSTADFMERHPNAARAAIMAVLEASRWIDASIANKTQMAEAIAKPAFVNSPLDQILPRMLGQYRDGLGRIWHDPRHVKFFDDGAVNFPYLSDGMWFLTQYKRWGLLRTHPDYLGVAERINRIDLYRDAAAALGVQLPNSPLRSSCLLDGGEWNGADPAAYADHFDVRAPAPRLEAA